MTKPPRKGPPSVKPGTPRTGDKPVQSRTSVKAPRTIAAEVTDIFDAFAIAAPGIAPIIASELAALGIAVEKVEDAGVSFKASRSDVARANLWLRTATRVIVRLASFEAVDFATLERKAKTVPWSRVISPGTSVRLRVTCKKSRLYHSDAVAQRVARGIEGAITRTKIIQRAKDDDTDVDSDDAASQLIIVRFDHDQCTISADSSGALLHRRGWRQAVAKAPLRETLAAALITCSEWDAKTALVDPFCGSGTLGIEAALKARNIAPGIGRSFAIEQWPGTSPGLLTTLRADAHRVARAKAGVPIVVSDRDAGACEAARANAERAGVLDDVMIVQRSLSETDLSSIANAGCVVTNPPYGVRVSEGKDLRALYSRLGDVMRAGGAAWRLTLVDGDTTLVRNTGLSLETRVRTTNGGLPVRLAGQN